MSRVFKVTFVIIGTIIGAGFASGQEIYTFFNKFGIYGLLGLTLSLFLISIIIYKTLKINIENSINNYCEFIKSILPERLKGNKILIFTISNIINIFLFISFNIMVSGFSAYFYQEFFIPRVIGGLIIAIASFIVFMKGIDSVIKINSYLIPVIFILIIILGIKKTNSIFILENNHSIYWFISSILYASYNSICLIPILINLKKHINTNKDAKLVCIFTFVIILILSIVIFLLMNTYFIDISNIEIPIVYIASLIGTFSKYIYGISVLIAIFTTAISSGYSFLKNVTNSQKSYLYLSIVICVISIVFSQINFSNLISTLYPVFGYLGILQIIFLLTA